MFPSLSASQTNQSAATSSGEFGDSGKNVAGGTHSLGGVNVATGRSNLAQSQTASDTSGINWTTIAIVAAAALVLAVALKRFHK